MSSSKMPKAAAALAVRDPRTSSRLGGATGHTDSTRHPLLQAVRLSAWRRIGPALEEQAQALQQRSDRNDIADIHLAADARTFEMLAHALIDLWETRRAAS